MITIITAIQPWQIQQKGTEETVKKLKIMSGGWRTSEGSPAEIRRAKTKQRELMIKDCRLKEGSSQRETSGLFGAQTHRPTAVHYKAGCGVGSKEKKRWDLRWIDHKHYTWWKQRPEINLKVKEEIEDNKLREFREMKKTMICRLSSLVSSIIHLYIIPMYWINATKKALQLIGVDHGPDLLDPE